VPDDPARKGREIGDFLLCRTIADRLIARRLHQRHAAFSRLCGGRWFVCDVETGKRRDGGTLSPPVS